MQTKRTPSSAAAAATGFRYRNASAKLAGRRWCKAKPGCCCHLVVLSLVLFLPSSGMELQGKVSYECDRSKRTGFSSGEPKQFRELDPQPVEYIGATPQLFQIYRNDNFTMELTGCSHLCTETSTWYFSIEKSPYLGPCSAKNHKEPLLCLTTDDHMSLRSGRGGKSKLLMQGTHQRVHFRFVGSEDEYSDCKCDVVLLRVSIVGEQEEATTTIPFHLLTGEAWEAKYGTRD